MNLKMNLNKLNYPMFKITLNEAFLLVEALKRLRGGAWYLCQALHLVWRHYPTEDAAVCRLKKKIRASLQGHNFLTEHMSPQLKNLPYRKGNSIRLRKAWIKKLLAYNGY